MRRIRAGKRGRWISLLTVGFVGYLLGGWHAAGFRSIDLSAAQNIALRFPEANADALVVEAAAEGPAGTISNATFKEARQALLNPQPMAPVAAAAPANSQPPQAREAVASLPPPENVPPPRPARPALAPHAEAKPIALTPSRAEAKSPSSAAQAKRPGFLLNDTQIASIKERLHLTTDQQRMWPAVEAALRNIAYAKAYYARHHGVPGSTETAALDSDSAEVQGLKSAAIPLLMSFNDEQKNEVRSLAHVMGLDQLASEF
jgi:hypothetical protein